MRLKSRISLYTGTLIVIAMAASCSVVIYRVWTQEQNDVLSFQKAEMNKARESVRDIVDVAYKLVEFHYQQNKDSGDYKLIKDQLAQLQYHEGQGYFWVTDSDLPYPTMIMNGRDSTENNQILKGDKYNLVEGKQGKNVHQERVEKVLTQDSAFVAYHSYVNHNDPYNIRMSYSKVFAPLGWIISSSTNIGAIQDSVAARKQLVDNRMYTLVALSVLIIVFVLLLCLLLVNYFAGRVMDVINVATTRLKDLSEGKEVIEIPRVRKDELGDMTEYLNELTRSFAHYTSFARDIGGDKLETDFELLSDDDVLGNELIKMRDSLMQNRRDGEVRNWTAEGLAKFAQILRIANNVKILAEEVIVNYVKYLNAIQGSVFLLTDSNHSDEEQLELVATYAYDRHKYLKRTLNLDEGLAGQCVREKAPIYLKEVPDDFVNIASGLGGESPSAILITPLIHDDEVFGVIEIASFNDFKPHELEFAEKVCESIAGTISSVQANEKTRTLLEQSQEMAQNMSAQEEELRQNQEELQATQEQMQRRQVELEEENEELRGQLQKQVAN